MEWVAEIGSAHNGSKSQAFEMIRQSALHGATIAKFQFGWTEEAQMKYAGNVNEVRYIDDWAEDLSAWCDHFDIEFMASIWSMEGLEVAREVKMKRYKIAHQMNDLDLIDLMLNDGKTIFSSNKDLYHPLVKRIWCTEGYPSYFPDWSCDRDGFNSFYGYSSHAHGYADALMTIPLYSNYIEKHVTLNKADTTLRDNSFALSFEEFGEMVRIGNEMLWIR